jgi:hypothetical protein
MKRHYVLRLRNTQLRIITFIIPLLYLYYSRTLLEQLALAPFLRLCSDQSSLLFILSNVNRK